MYAVIETGGKQYRVELGTELEVELLDAEPGQEIKLERVLLVADGEKTVVGQPVVKDAAVDARVVRQDRGEKLISFKYRPKARRRVKKGHRQELTVIEITDVRLGARSAAARAKEAKAQAAAERERVEKAAGRQAAEDAALAAKLKARAKRAAAPSEKPAAKAAPKAAPKAAGKAAPKAATPEKAAEAEKAPEDEKAAEAEKAPEAEGEAPAKRTKKEE